VHLGLFSVEGYRNFLIFRTRLADLFNLAINVEVSKNAFVLT